MTADERNEVLVSAVTVAEIAIKRSVGKLEGPDGFLGALVEKAFALATYDIRVLHCDIESVTG